MTDKFPRTPDEPIDFRSVGFTDLAANYPRDDLARAMFAAFNNVRVDQLPPAMRYFPNEATKAAWTRVADAAVAHILRREDAASDIRPAAHQTRFGALFGALEHCNGT